MGNFDEQLERVRRTQPLLKFLRVLRSSEAQFGLDACGHSENLDGGRCRLRSLWKGEDLSGKGCQEGVRHRIIPVILPFVGIFLGVMEKAVTEECHEPVQNRGCAVVADPFGDDVLIDSRCHPPSCKVQKVGGVPKNPDVRGLGM